MAEVIDLAKVRAAANFMGALGEYVDHLETCLVEGQRRLGTIQCPNGWEPMPPGQWQALLEDLSKSHRRMIRAGAQVAEMAEVRFDRSFFILPPEDGR
jgi:hypothetical protein